MSDPKYSYLKVNAIKVIIENSKGEILLIQEPVTNEWMPGHWGLPGGRAQAKESLHDALKRRSKEELGIEIEARGVFRVEELLEDDKTIFMFVVVSIHGQRSELKDLKKKHKWVDIEEIKKMATSEFTEFYHKSLLLDYFSGARDMVDFDLINTQQYYDMHENPEYKKWLQSGKKINNLK